MANSTVKLLSLGYADLEELADDVAERNGIDDNTRTGTRLGAGMFTFAGSMAAGGGLANVGKLAGTASKIGSALNKGIQVAGKAYNAIDKVDNAYHTIASAARAGDAFLDGDIKGGLSNVAFAGLGALGTTSIKRAKAKPAAPRGGAGPVRVGQAGEHAVGISGPRIKIEINGRKRIPDHIDRKAKLLTEVKNVKSQSYTRQLRDYSDIAKQQGLTFELWVRPDTKLYGPLVDAIGNKDIILKYIPS